MLLPTDKMPKTEETGQYKITETELYSVHRHLFSLEKYLKNKDSTKYQSV